MTRISRLPLTAVTPATVRQCDSATVRQFDCGAGAAGPGSSGQLTLLCWEPPHSAAPLYTAHCTHSTVRFLFNTESVDSANKV